MSEHLPDLIRTLRDSGVADHPGKLLYSGLSTLRPGTIYLLGYNPGGDPGHERASVLTHLTRTDAAEANEYLDVAWTTTTYSFRKGEAPLQKRICYLLKGIDLHPRLVCASNLIFARSKNEQLLESPEESAANCWPVHRLILDTVRPRAIVVFGGRVRDFILSKAIDVQPTESRRAEHGTWKCLATRLVLDGRPITLISLPHLSRYAITGHPEVVDWVRAQIEGPA